MENDKWISQPKTKQNSTPKKHSHSNQNLFIHFVYLRQVIWNGFVISFRRKISCLVTFFVCAPKMHTECANCQTRNGEFRKSRIQNLNFKIKLSVRFDCSSALNGFQTSKTRSRLTDAASANGVIVWNVWASISCDNSLRISFKSNKFSRGKLFGTHFQLFFPIVVVFFSLVFFHSNESEIRVKIFDSRETVKFYWNTQLAASKLCVPLFCHWASKMLFFLYFRSFGCLLFPRCVFYVPVYISWHQKQFKQVQINCARSHSLYAQTHSIRHLTKKNDAHTFHTSHKEPNESISWIWYVASNSSKWISCSKNTLLPSSLSFSLSLSGSFEISIRTVSLSICTKTTIFFSLHRPWQRRR